MKSLSLGGIEGIGLVVVIGSIAYVLHKQGVLAAVAKPGALNPGSANNLAYVSTNAIGAAATGDKNFTLGGWIYDLFHADPMTQPLAAARVNLGSPTNNRDPTAYGAAGAINFGSFGVTLPALFPDNGGAPSFETALGQVPAPAVDNPTYDPGDANTYGDWFHYTAGA